MWRKSFQGVWEDAGGSDRLVWDLTSEKTFQVYTLAKSAGREERNPRFTSTITKLTDTELELTMDVFGSVDRYTRAK